MYVYNKHLPCIAHVNCVYTSHMLSNLIACHDSDVLIFYAHYVHYTHILFCYVHTNKHSLILFDVWGCSSPHFYMYYYKYNRPYRV